MLKIIYTAMFVLKLITEHTHHKLKASAAWLSLPVDIFLAKSTCFLHGRWPTLSISMKGGSVPLMLCNQ